MSARISMHFFVAVVALLATLAFAGAASASTTGVIEGHVTSSSSGSDLSGICVSAYSNTGGGYGYATTGPGGTYTISGLTNDADYTVSFYDCNSVDGTSYVTQYFDGKTAFYLADEVHVGSDATPVTGIDAQMLAGGSISGRVTDAQHPDPQDPAHNLAGFCVYAYEAATHSSTAFAQTASDGTYTISGLAPGTDKYKVRFDACGQGNFLGEWWNDQQTEQAAATISVTAGQATPNVDAQLEPGATISGVVTKAGVSAPDDKLRGICVSAQSATPSGGYYYYGYYSATTDADGHYTIAGLPAGNYKILFSGCAAGYDPQTFTPIDTNDYVDQWYDGKPDFQSATTVSLASAEQRTGVGAAMVLGGTISGHVYAGAGTSSPLANCTVTAERADGQGGPGFFYSYGFGAPTDSTGAYRLRGLAPGDYKVHFGSCFGAGQYASEYWDNEVDFRSADSVSVTAGSTAGDKDGHLAAAGSISGTVTDGSSQPVFACVSAYSASASSGFDQFHPIATTTTSSSGQYLLGGLGEGSYKLRFEDCDDAQLATEYWDNQPDLASANTVSVTSGATTSGKNAQLEPGGTITGLVTNNASTPAPEAGVCVAALDAAGNAIDGSLSYGDGRYSIDGLRPGSYKVEFFTDGCPYTYRSFQTQYFNGKATLGAADSVAVTAGGTASNVGAQLIPTGGAISGHVADSATPTPANLADVCVSAVPTSGYGYGFPYYDYYFGSASALATTNTSGNYTIDGLRPGDYLVYFESCDEPTHVPEWYDDAEDPSSAQHVHVSDAQTTTGIDAQLGDTARIGGTVKDAAGAPIDDICVFAYDPSGPDPGSEPGGYGYLTAYGYTNENGAYTVYLPTGSYKLRFSDCDFLGAVWNSEWYNDKSSYGDADPVSATTGSTTTLQDVVLTTSDSTAPNTTITSGPAEGSTTSSQSASFAFSSSESNSSFDCKLDTGAWSDCEDWDAQSYSGLSNGPHTFSVRATDRAHNTDATEAVRHWTVDTASSTPTTTEGTVGSNGTVSTDPTGAGPSASDPVTAAVKTPQGGTVTITEQPAGAAPSGYDVFGTQVEISAPDGTLSNPLELTFVIDASAIPAGTALGDITIIRNGTDHATECPGATTVPDADHPCIKSRTLLPGGDVRIVVLTQHASQWNLARVTPPQNGDGASSGGSGDSGTTTPSTTTTTTATPTQASSPTQSGTTPTQTTAGTKCVVPKLKGMKLTAAKKALAKAHCGVGKITRKKAKRKQRGKVIRQSLKPGTAKPAGSKVALTVGK